jgi:hypothetical protein
MNKLPLGTKVKVIKAQAGAYDAIGWVGTIVSEQKIDSGLDKKESEVFVKLEDGRVWGIGMWYKIELEVVKPIYNKAQQKCIKKWNDAFEYRNLTKPDFARFIDEFNAIEPTPDPVEYKVMFKSTFDTAEWVENLAGAKSSLEDCSEYLKETINYIGDVIEYKENEYLKIRDDDMIHEFKIVLA